MAFQSNAQNQPKYQFVKKKIEVFEPVKADTTIMVGLIANSLPTGTTIDTLKITEVRGDAGVRDYKIDDTIIILMYSGAQKNFGIYLQINHDAEDEPAEDFKLALQYKIKNVAGNDSLTVYDTTTIVIKDPVKTPKTKAEEDLSSLEESFYTNTFILNDTSYLITIKDTSVGHTMQICKTMDINIPKDICRKETINTGIEESEFIYYFKRLLSKVGTTESSFENGRKIIDSTVSRKYLEWKNSIDNKKGKITLAKENIDNESKLKAQGDEILKIVKSYLKNFDTSYSYIGSTLSNIQLYNRQFGLGIKPPTKGIIDQIKYPEGFVEYLPCVDSLINFDSVSIRIEDGFLERIILSPSKDAIKNYSFNDHIIIRKHYDLRSTTDVHEVMNMYLPLDSRKAYVKFSLDTTTNSATKKIDTAYYPKGFDYAKSKDEPKYNYYSSYYVKLGDVVQYNPNPDSLPDVIRNVRNINLTFRANEKPIVKLRDKDFNSFSQLNIYTDLIGFSEDKPNGLVQAEGKFETGIFNQPIFNRSYYKKVRIKLLPSAYASFTISKIENKLRHYLVPKDNVVLYNEIQKKFDDTTNRRRFIRNVDILQYSSLLINAHFNLFSIESDFTQIKIYVEGGIIRTPINDTTNGTDNLGKPIVNDSTTVLNSLKTCLGLAIKLKATSKLGVDFGIEWQRATLNNNLLTQVYTSYDNVKRKEELKESVYRAFPSFRFQMVVPNVNIYYFLDRDYQNRLYLRGKYFKQLKSRSDNLVFIQFGYSTDLNGFFGLFKKSE